MTKWVNLGIGAVIFVASLTPVEPTPLGEILGAAIIADAVGVKF